jgi:hypothetical protein
MATKIYENGTVEVTVPANEKITVFSNGTYNVYQQVGYPNHPDEWSLLNAGAAGATYLSAAFTAATLVRVEMSADFGFYEVGAAPVVAEPMADQEFADATGVISGLAAAQGGSSTIKGGTSSTAGNAGGAAAVLGGQPGATGVGGAATVTGGAGGATSGTGGAATVTGGAGTAGNANGGSVELTPGAAHGTGVAGNVGIHGLIVVDQGAPNDQTVAATLTIANLLTGIVTGTHAAGATQAYTLPTGTLTDAAVQLAAGEAFEWSLINLSAAAADSITVTAGVDHTLVGSGIVPSAHATTGGLSSNGGRFRTRKTAANTYVTYRIA